MTESSSYEERHSRAADTFAVFVPGTDPERVSASLTRRLGALGGFAFAGVPRAQEAMRTARDAFAQMDS